MQVVPFFSSYQFSMTARCLAATVGAYAFAFASSFGMVTILVGVFGALKADAVYLGTLLSYIFGFSAIIWTFCQRTALLAWRDIIIGCAVFMAIYYWGSV